MRLTRFLKPAQIKLELATKNPSEVPETMSRERAVWQIKEGVLSELVVLLEASGKIVNSRKLATDMTNRERKASTGIGNGVAIPHVRTMQARDFTLAFARSSEGVEFDAIDQQPVHLFFAVVSPPYDDAMYLKVYKQIGEILMRQENFQGLLQARDAHEVIKIIGQMDR